jgi:hypothetical protein
MAEFPTDIFTEPEFDPDGLKNLGPLRAMAGRFEGQRGVDRHPEADGPLEEPFIEHYLLEPIDPQTNGPQLFYGLRYHTFITRPNQVKAFHDQVGFWLWEPATSTVLLTMTIPRGYIAMAAGATTPDAKRFELAATDGAPHHGILSNPFLDYAYKTLSYRVTVTIESDDVWSYEQDTVLKIAGQAEPFHHTDRNTLRRIAPPILNPQVR